MGVIRNLPVGICYGHFNIYTLIITSRINKKKNSKELKILNMQKIVLKRFIQLVFKIYVLTFFIHKLSHY